MQEKGLNFFLAQLPSQSIFPYGSRTSQNRRKHKMHNPYVNWNPNPERFIEYKKKGSYKQ